MTKQLMTRIQRTILRIAFETGRPIPAGPVRDHLRGINVCFTDGTLTVAGQRAGAELAALTPDEIEAHRALAENTIRTAQEHAHLATMRSSADLCIADAQACYARKDYRHAYGRARDSLKYSVGIFSPVYIAIQGVEI